MDEHSSSGADALRSISEEDLDFEARSRLASVRHSLFGVNPQPLRIGRFVLMEPLGAGGMGIVYAAHDPRLERKIALKVVKPDLSASLKDEARLLREAQAMARLSHPNVVQIHEVGVADGRLFIAMELVTGRTLASWLAAPGRSWREIVGVFIEAGRGLAAAHAAGIVHRDFKPENVLCGGDGRARVTDFGLARGGATTERSDPHEPPSGTPGPGAASLTTSGAIAGTPYYMAPELFLARPADAASDQFSFCVALYHALHGVRPFAGDDRAALVRAVLAGQRQEPPRLRFPRRIHRALVRGLSTAPEERFASMDALLAAIGPVSLWRRAGLVAASVGVGAVLVGGAALLGAFASEVRVCTASSARFDVATGAEPYRVPAGCRVIRVQAWGAGGGGAMHPGGGGGYTEAALAVEPGQELSVAVGGGGGSWANGAYQEATGGSPGGSGGYAGAASGGLSGVREGIVWLLVAGGGGGAGASGAGGGGGGPQGQGGGPYSTLQGHGGTPLAGGAGGHSLFGATPGKDGTGTRGGVGGASVQTVLGDPNGGVGGGAGGGGMWAGGGGGGDGRGLLHGGMSGGGGGGSGYVAPTRAIPGTLVLMTANRQEPANAGTSEGAGRGGDARVPERSEATAGRSGLVYITTAGR